MNNPLCEICREREANGAIGSLTDETFVQWVCSNCYYNVLKMRPLSQVLKNKNNNGLVLPVDSGTKSTKL